ncbi:hypothetical protein KI387_038680, partial [Taxus chinensis]
MVNYSADDLLKINVINHPHAHNKALTALDYWVDQMEYILERIDKIKDEALEARYNMEQTVAKMAPGMLSESYNLREVDDTFQHFKAIVTQ